MKKVVLMFLAIVLAGCLVLTGCGEKDVEQEVYELKLAHPWAVPAEDAEHSVAVSVHNWVKRVELETNGRVKITIYPAESLLKQADLYEGVALGLADLSYTEPRQVVGRFPLYTIFDLPGIPWPNDGQLRLEIVDTMLDKYPALREQTSDVKVVYQVDNPPGCIAFSTNVKVTHPDQLRGKVFGSGTTDILLAEALGASATFIAPGDRYIALERKTVDGIFTAWGGVRVFNWYEVIGAYTENFGMPRMLSFMVMNTDSWNKLPKDIQDTIEGLSEWGSAESSRGAAMGTVVSKRVSIEEYGIPVYEPSPAELEVWIEKLAPVQTDWIDNAVKAGFANAAEILDDLKDMCMAYQQ